MSLMKNILDVINSRLDILEEKLIELKDRALQILQMKTERSKIKNH